MKKILLFLTIIIISTVVWFGESRKFFSLENGEYITVWKTYNNVSYVIPGKYYGITKPSKRFIESSNTNYITIYHSAELPNAFIFQSSEEVKVNNVVKNDVVFYDYTKDTSRFDKILYVANPKNRSDLKTGAELMNINIHENYATDKTGKKLYLSCQKYWED